MTPRKGDFMDEKQKIIRTALIVLFVLIVLGAAYYFFIAGRSKAPEPGGGLLAEPKSAGEEAAAKEAPAVSPLTVGLDESDDAVRGLAADLSSHPLFGQWIKSKELLRKFAAAVDNIANGQSPRPQFDFFTLPGEFKTVARGGRIILDPASYDRYNGFTDVFDSLSTSGCARAYAGVKPLLQQAYRELGYPNEDFHQTLLRAIQEILKTPVVEDPIALEKGITTYFMSDPKLESLSPAQKHLLRMGPENLQLIQAKLREIALALGFGEEQLPRPRSYSPGK
jgi:hypothetical protein